MLEILLILLKMHFYGFGGYFSHFKAKLFFKCTIPLSETVSRLLPCSRALLFTLPHLKLLLTGGATSPTGGATAGGHLPSSTFPLPPPPLPDLPWRGRGPPPWGTAACRGTLAMGGWTGVGTGWKHSHPRLHPHLSAPCIQGLASVLVLLLSWEGGEGLVGKFADEVVGETELPGDWVRSQV